MSQGRKYHRLSNAIFGFILTLGMVGCHAPKADSPKALFESIQQAAKSSSEGKLRALIYPLVIGEHDIQAQMVDGILTGKKSGDGAYSDKAISKMIALSPLNFTALSKEDLDRKFLREGATFASDAQLKTLATQQPEAIVECDEEGIYVLLVRLEDAYQLLFWESIPRIL